MISQNYEGAMISGSGRVKKVSIPRPAAPGHRKQPESSQNQNRTYRTPIEKQQTQAIVSIIMVFSIAEP